MVGGGSSGGWCSCIYLNRVREDVVARQIRNAGLMSSGRDMMPEFRIFKLTDFSFSTVECLDS